MSEFLMDYLDKYPNADKEWLDEHNKLNMNNEKLDFDEGSYYDLLKEALHYLNMIPRKNIKSENTKDSYELASMIDKYVKNMEL